LARKQVEEIGNPNSICEDFMTKKMLRLLLLMLLVLMVVNTTSAQDSKVLVTAVGAGDPHSLDPQRVSDTNSWNLSNVLFPGLTILDEETREVTPGIVTGWDISEDGLVYTFHLIENIPWVRYNADSGAVEQVMDGSGNPRYLTAQDVVYGWTRALDPATAAAGAYMVAPIVVGGTEFNGGSGIADSLGIRAVDDLTVEITTPESVGYALGIMGLINSHPSPQWAIEANGDAWTEPENIATFGPFALKEWVHEDHLTYIRNPFWPGSAGYGQAHLDEVVIRFLDLPVQLNEYEAGNLDVVNEVPGDQFDRISTDPVLSEELTVFAGQCTEAWNFHTEKPPFDNAHIRRAFTFAVDRQSLADNIFKGGRIAARWYTPPSIAFAPTLEANPDLGVWFDPELAQEELQLGLTELGLASVDELPSITVDFGNSATNNAVAQALQVMWQDTLGITVSLNPMDTTTYWTIMGEDAGQIHRGGWCPDYNDANNFTRDVFYPGGSNNFGRWNNPEWVALIDEARVSSDPARRLELYAQAEEIEVATEAATIPLVWQSIPTLTKPYVTRTFAPNRVEAYWKWDINR
jgi:oligopeptide transport system substrate-binding protein